MTFSTIYCGKACDEIRREMDFAEFGSVAGRLISRKRRGVSI
jgi:hypothetical protein